MPATVKHRWGNYSSETPTIQETKHFMAQISTEKSPTPGVSTALLCPHTAEDHINELKFRITSKYPSTPDRMQTPKP